MEKERVRIVDIAQELGLSTATVSNVIHGKTKKISDETVKRVQELLEKRQYIPSMAGILLAQNDSMIIGVVIHDHPKYEGHTLEDPFIAASMNALAREIELAGKFLMLKVTDRWDQIPKFASMWNMEGMVLIGFCGQDYQQLRQRLRIPFVVYDGCMESSGNLADIEVDHFGGGALAGEYLKRKGHRSALCIADNNTCMDADRFLGLRSQLPDAELMIVPMEREARAAFYREHLEKIRSHTAVFAVSDYYAMDFIRFANSVGLGVPENLSVIGFDDVREGEKFQPPLTTIRQDHAGKAALAVELLRKLKNGSMENNVTLSVTLVERGSVGNV